MSLVEYRSWVRFRRRRGSLHLGMRVERGVGLLCALLANQNRDSKRQPEPFRVEDFMEHLDAPRDALEDAMASWS